MTLTAEQRAELEARGPETIRLKLGTVSISSPVPGLNTAPLRADVEDWLGEKSAQDAAERKQTFRLAIIAAIASAVAAAASVAALFR